MRQLTLNEKINIKADLARFGIPKTVLVQLNTRSALFFGGVCYQDPVNHFRRINGVKTDLSRHEKRLGK